VIAVVLLVVVRDVQLGQGRMQLLVRRMPLGPGSRLGSYLIASGSDSTPTAGLSDLRLNLRVGRIGRRDQVPREERQDALLDPLADLVRVVAVVLLVVVGNTQLGHRRM